MSRCRGRISRASRSRPANLGNEEMVSIEKTNLDAALILTPRRFRDERGWFSETWNRRDLAAAGIDLDFVQDNHSYSAPAGTLRGLHYQAPPHAQDKLVFCTRGAILDVAVDVRKGSPTFGQWMSVELTPDNGKQVLLPKGLLHGFLTLLPDSEVQYKCTDYYAPDCDGAVRWNSLGIDWSLQGEPILSAKDATAPMFENWTSPFVWKAAT